MDQASKSEAGSGNEAVGPSADAEELTPLTPTRDPAFVRIAADLFLCRFIADDRIEIALMGRTNNFTEVMFDEEGFARRSIGRPTIADLGRLSMDASEAGKLAYDILLALADSGNVDLAAFDSNVALVRKVIEAEAEKNDDA